MLASGTKKAPPANVVLPHYAFGALSFFVLSILMFISAAAFTGHYFSPELLAITHLAVLGWICMIIFGALYQLLPVILLSELFSDTLARVAFGLFAIGVILLAYAFWSFSVGVPLQVASVLLLMAVVLFCINIYLTAKKAVEVKTEGEFILTSAIWLLVAVVIGVLMVFNFTHPFLPTDHLVYLKLHSHIGFGGWFVLLVIGVSSKLIPMFLLSSEVSTKKIKRSYYFINAALIGFLADTLIFCSTARASIYFGIAVIGLLFYLSFIYDVYKCRARKNADIGMKHSLLAFLFVFVLIVSGVVVHGNILGNEIYAMRLTLLYGTSVIIGFLSLLILGQTFKTLPFIVWLHKYGKLAGKGKTPLPKDLFSEKIAKLQFVGFVTTYPVLLIGIGIGQIVVIQAACILLILTATLYNVNVFKILLHKTKFENYKTN